MLKRFQVRKIKPIERVNLFFSTMMQESMRGYGWNEVSNDEFGAGVGVEVKGIVESDAPLQPRYEPDHPMANETGYVYYSNVNPVEEMADMMSASRSFQD